MNIIDSHCHIHDTEFYADTREEVYARAVAAGVSMVAVSTDERSSREAVAFAESHDHVWPIVGVHPHDTSGGWSEIVELATHKAVVGIGEIGLDYYYDNSPRAVQREGLEAQLQIALDNNLPVSFHVREAKDITNGSVWDDFWPIFDNFHGIRGVLHSFTDIQENLDRGFARGLYVGVNGISTFTKDTRQQQLYAEIPLEKALVETDAPFLTPAPFRGKMNEPSFVRNVAEHMAMQRNVSFDVVAQSTTKNTQALFNL